MNKGAGPRMDIEERGRRNVECRRRIEKLQGTDIVKKNRRGYKKSKGEEKIKLDLAQRRVKLLEKN